LASGMLTLYLSLRVIISSIPGAIQSGLLCGKELLLLLLECNNRVWIMLLLRVLLDLLLLMLSLLRDLIQVHGERIVAAGVQDC